MMIIATLGDVSLKTVPVNVSTSVAHISTSICYYCAQEQLRVHRLQDRRRAAVLRDTDALSCKWRQTTV